MKKKGALREDPRRRYGDGGEASARAFLEGKGMRFVCGNFRTRWGEIDLVMNDGPYLVFVEVKRRHGDGYGAPEEAVTRAKKEKMVRAAMSYVQRYVDGDKMIRFDVVSIGPDGLRHIPEAFSDVGDYYY